MNKTKKKLTKAARLASFYQGAMTLSLVWKIQTSKLLV